MTLEVHGLKKTFGTGDAKTDVLKGIDFSASSGELIILSGASGSGKSTLLSILGGLLSHTDGEVKLDDVDYLDLSEKELTQMRLSDIGFIFQSSHLIPYMDIVSQLSFVAEQNGLNKKEARKRSKALLEEIGLSHRFNSYPGMLSGGERQRAAIMRALMNKPKMLLADEPTASLDGARAIEVVEMLRDIVKDRGMIGILITHDSCIFEYADRVLTLEDGHLKAESHTQESQQ
ncbi:ABC transporter ATP-binding protein [Salinicoccus siamensis]|uniref:Putative hemin import ATP-binding protein HrtA n=1 Tax=Salinicoccus siamensis TaxID=381830 RepID=A0ABV5Z548_9STAP